MGIDGPGTSVVFAVPDVAENVGARQDMIAVTDEKLQQLELAAGQVDPLAVDLDRNALKGCDKVAALIMGERVTVIFVKPSSLRPEQFLYMPRDVAKLRC